ncbi:MAG: 30S ribosomal protein S18 [Chloroflexi bacterium]|nr:30S ribosomal protein S18 [Chloroflexota bacterium]
MADEQTRNTDSQQGGSSGGGERRSEHRGRRPGGRPGRGRRRGCPFKVNGKCKIDYKDVDTLRLYLTDTGKIRPRRQTGACSKCQRALSIAIKRARFLALLPHAPDHIRQHR